MFKWKILLHKHMWSSSCLRSFWSPKINLFLKKEMTEKASVTVAVRPIDYSPQITEVAWFVHICLQIFLQSF